MDAVHVDDDLINVLFTEKQIQDRLAEMAATIRDDYAGKDLLLVGVLRGAVMVMADLSRHLDAAPRDGLDGGLVVRLGHQVVRRRTDPQGPRHRHLRPPRADRRRDHRHRPDPQLAGVQPRLPQPGVGADRDPAPQARGGADGRRRDRTSGGTSRTSSSSATDSTTTSATATCATSARSRPTSTPDPVPPRARRDQSDNQRLAHWRSRVPSESPEGPRNRRPASPLHGLSRWM